MKPRTRKQSIAYAHGKYAYRSTRGTDVQAVAKRVAAQRANADRGQQTCWNCLAGFDSALDICPHCKTAVVPF